MDALSRIAREHGQVYESLAVFQKLSEIEKTRDSFAKIKEFFRGLIMPHFQYEEEELLPIMSTQGTDEEKELARFILNDHYKIIEAFNKFSIASYMAGVSAKGSDISNAFNLIVKMIMEHARKEDSSFYPALEKYIKK